METDPNDEDLDPTFVESVIEHMNEDHADALILYVRAYTEFGETNQATLVAIDRQEMRLTIEQNETPVSIVFDPPLKDASEVRSRLVQLVKQARVQLGEN